MVIIAVCFALVLAVILLVFFAGPRVSLEPDLKPIALPENLDEYLKQSEAAFSDIVPGAEKTIIWANPEKTKTALAVIYLHGYSATRQETAPLSEHIAKKLGANLFCTRLSGHGRGGAAMAEACANDWLNDSLEALAIGKRLGEKIIIISVSTGGTLAAWLAQRPESADVLAVIMISPNFALKDPKTEILTWPWAKYLVPMIVGPEYSWEPANAMHARYWSNRYPSTAIIQMMGLVKFVNKTALETITKPVLVIYCPADTVVNEQETERRFAQFGSPDKKIISIPPVENFDNHVIAGDILAPNDTPKIEKLILDYLAHLI